MSIDQLALPKLDVELPTETRPANGHRPHTDGEQPPRVVILATITTDTIDTLLLLIAHGDQTALDTLQNRTTGLVQVNIRRILRDATRSEAVTQQTFTDLLHDAADFDPHRDDALTWLLTRAHQHAMDRLHTIDTTTNTTTDTTTADTTTGEPAPTSHTH